MLARSRGRDIMLADGFSSSLPLLVIGKIGWAGRGWSRRIQWRHNLTPMRRQNPRFVGDIHKFYMSDRRMMFRMRWREGLFWRATSRRNPNRTMREAPLGLEWKISTTGLSFLAYCLWFNHKSCINVVKPRRKSALWDENPNTVQHTNVFSL